MALRQTPRKLYWPKLYQFELYKRNSYNFNVNILFWNDKYSSRFSEEKFSRFMWIKKKKTKRKGKENKENVLSNKIVFVYTRRFSVK